MTEATNRRRELLASLRQSAERIYLRPSDIPDTSSTCIIFSGINPDGNSRAIGSDAISITFQYEYQETSMLFLIKDSTGQIRIIAQGEARMQSKIAEIAGSIAVDGQIDYETFAKQLLSVGFNIMGYRTIETEHQIND